MLKSKILILIAYFLVSTAVFAQDYLFFTNSDDPTYYDPSYLYVTSPSALLTVNSNKFPVNADTFYSPSNSIKLQWNSMVGGDWGSAIAAPGWPGRDVTEMDSVSMWVYPTQTISSASLPVMYLEDLSNQKTEKVNISDYHGNVTAGIWTNIKVPISIFESNPGAADLTRIKVIYLGQGSADSVEHTLFIDEVKITGNPTQDKVITNIL